MLLAALLLFAGAYFTVNREGHDHSGDLARVQKTLENKEKRAIQEAEELAALAGKKSYFSLFGSKSQYYEELYEDKGIILMMYERDSLRLWSEQSVAVEIYHKGSYGGENMVRLKNGWYQVIARPVPNSTRMAVAMIEIKKQFSFQNRFLVNEFFPGLGLPNNVKMVLADASTANSIHNSKGDYLFSLQFHGGSDEWDVSWLSIFLYLLAFLFSVLLIKSECEALSASLGHWTMLLFAATLIALRSVTILIHFPEELQYLSLFNPKYYGDANSFWLPSLGDFLINSLLAFYICYYVHKRIRIPAGWASGKKWFGIGVSFALLFGLFWGSRLLNLLYIGLIENSNISLNVNDLFSLNIYSYIALLITGLMLFSFFLVVNRVVEALLDSGLTLLQSFGAFAAALLTYIFISQGLGTLDEILFLWPAVVVLVIAWIKKTADERYTFSGIVLLLLIVSLFSAHVLIKYGHYKEQYSRRIFAEKLAAERDPVAEHLFCELEQRLEADTALRAMLDDPAEAKSNFSKQLIQSYFGGHWEKYEVKIAVFDTACLPVVNGINNERDDLTFYEESIKDHSSPTECKSLFYLDDPTGKISFLSKIDIYSPKRPGSKPSFLFLELSSKFVSEEVGFPELLLEGITGLNQELAAYSYAKYKNGELVNYHGKYPYSESSEVFLDPLMKNSSFRDLDGYNHLLYKADTNTLVVLSRKDDGLIGTVTTFSYLFAFFSILLLLFLLTRQFSRGLFLTQLSFKSRIQYLLVLIVLVSLALFGGGTIFYIQKQYEAKNKENLSDKLLSALVEVQQELGDQEGFRPSSRDYLSYILKGVSNIFFVDINLYDTSGTLLASSSMKVFDEGLMSANMCPEAYYQLAVNRKLEYIADERIGQLGYLSAYVPFKNDNGKLVAYLNMPYFSKQSELEKEISTYLVALINIYVLLFVLSVGMALFISGYVTKPLKLVQDKLSKIKLGKTNEQIEWKEDDEIGSLVSEYNRMIVELANSAELLARSERESAWREMAKQVAHEIKNPLTPMKLSVQHMQRLIKDKSADLETKMERLAKTLIEQIETLSAIATEFSNFAKMPKANKESLPVNSTLQNTVNLFKETEEAEVVFRPSTIEILYVYADKDQLVRVFNNLIKNAIQAIPEGRKGVVEVSLEKKGTKVLISVKDNGTGISEDAMDKIFVPNFTTKTTGMGLGLAMVKNIVEGFEGHIWFETEKDKGTAFHVELPIFVQ